jgi:hypothetical protein
MKIFLQKSLIYFTILAALLLFSSTVSFAQSDNFQSFDGGGEWNDGASWTNLTNNTLRTFPIAGDEAYVVGGDVIDVTATTGAAACATLVVNTGGILRLRGAGVSSLTVSGQLIMNSGSSSTLNVGNGINTSKTLSVGSAVITAGILNVIGTVNVTGGNFSLGGAGVTSIFDLSGSVASLNVTNGDVTIGTNGSVIGSSSSTISVSGSGKALIVNAGGSLTVNSTAIASVRGFTTNVSAGSITIAGSININGGIWSNGGAVSGISGRVYNYSALNTANSAAITLSTGGILNGPSNNATEGLGDGAIASSIDLTNGSISSLGVASTIKINGAFTIPTGSFAAGLSTISTYGTSSITAGSTISLNNVTVNSGTLNLASTGTIVTVAGNLINNGALTVAGLYQFTTLSNTGGLTNTGTVSINGSFTDNGSLNSTSGTFDFNGTGTMTLSTTAGTKFFNLTHSGNAALNGSGDFEVAGNYLNSGSGVGTYSTGTVTFSGTGKTIYGGSSGTTFNNMIVTGSRSMVDNANNNVNLTGTLTLSGSGDTFDADGNAGSGFGVFTIRSTSATSTGSIAAIPTGATLSGKMTIQRYFTSGTSWKYLSIPISSTFYVSDLQAGGFNVNGHFASGGSDNPSGLGPIVGESMFTWDAPYQEYLGIGWGAGATSATQLSNTTGYVAYYYGAAGAISLTGVPKTGNAVIPLDRTKTPFDNLIPNPYPSAIDFKKFRTRESTLVGTQMSIQTATGNLAYLTYDGFGDPLLGSSYSAANVGVLGGSWKGEIALGQSFWISPGVAGDLTLLESDKTTAASTYAGKTDGTASTAESVSVRLSLTSGLDSDETVFLFTDKGSLDFVERKDFVKKLRTTPDLAGVTDKAINFYSSKGGNPLVFNFLPLIDCNAPSVSAKMGINISPSRQHTINFSNVQEFSLGYIVKLVDKFLNKEINLTTSKQYSFISTDQLESYDINRFELKFEPKPLISPVVTVEGTKISIPKDKFVQWYKDGKAIDGATNETYVATESGSYSVKSGASLNCQTESLPVVLVITSLDKESFITAYPNPVGDIVTVSFPSNFKITAVSLLDSKGSQISNLERVASTDNSLSLDISSNPSGLYFIRLKSTDKIYSIKILKK